MAKPASAWYLAGVATVASTLGSVYGYALGHLGYQWVDTGYGDWVSGSWLAAVLNGFDRWGVLIVLIAALLPLPFRFVTIGAGVSGMGIVPFVVIAALGAAFSSLWSLSSLPNQVAKHRHFILRQTTMKTCHD